MGIRQVPPSIRDPNLAGFLRELRAAIGGVSDQVTKIIQARSSSGGNGNGGGTGPGGGGTDPGGTDPTPKPPTGDGYPPPPPTSLTATGGLASISLVWENPLIVDYLETEIWATRSFATYDADTKYLVNAKVLYDGVVYNALQGNSASGEDAVDNTGHTPNTSPTWWEATSLTQVESRVLVGAVSGTAWTFTRYEGVELSPDETWAFWVRNHDTENLFSTYYPDDNTGIVATTLRDPGTLLKLLTGAVTDSILFKNLGDRINLITADSLIPNSVNARLADQYDSLVQQISEVSVGSAGFDSRLIWYFDATSDITGWTTNAGTLAVTASNVTFTPDAPATAPSFTTATFDAISGTTYSLVRVRIKRGDPGLIGTPTWLGTLSWWASTNTTSTPTGSLSVSEPPGLDTGYAELTWDLHLETDWTSYSINKLRFALSDDSDANSDEANRFSIDWLGIGRNAPGASYYSVDVVRVLADNKTRAFYQDSPPTSTSTYTLKDNDLWFDTNNGNKAYRWNGSTTNTTVNDDAYGTHWLDTTDTRLADSWSEIVNIRNITASPTDTAAQVISGISSTATSAATTASTNDAWITSFQSTYASDTAATASQISTLSAKVNVKTTTFVQSTTPSSVDRVIGDVWFDTTSATNVLMKKWTGSAWVLQRVDAKTYYASTAPTTNLQTGDLWIDTGNGNKLFRWSGSAWTAADDARIAANEVAISTESDTRATADGKLFAQWSVKIDANGYVSGFGLATDNSNGTSFSDFMVRADRISFVSPSPTTTPYSRTISTVTVSGSTATITFTASHNFVVYEWVQFTGFTGDVRWNGTWQVKTVTSTQITVTVPSELQAILTTTTASTGTRLVARKADQVPLTSIVRATTTTGINTIDLAGTTGTATVYLATLTCPFAHTLSTGTNYSLPANTTFVTIRNGTNGWNGTYRVYDVPSTTTVRIAIASGSVGNYPTPATAESGQVLTFTAANSPMIVTTTTQYVPDGNGKYLAVSPGLYVNHAQMMYASIGEAQIQKLSVNNAAIKDYIYSTDCLTSNGVPVASTTSGWYIDKAGSAVFNNARVRGDIVLGGGNMIQNSEALNGLDGHVGSVFNLAVASSTLGNGLSSTKPVGSECVVVSSTAGQSSASGFIDFGNPAFPGKVAVQPTKYYEFSVYTGAVNCTVSLELIFLSSGGTELGRFNGSSTNASQSSGGSLLSGYKRLVVRGTAPTNTAYAVPRLVRSAPTTNAAATMYGTRAFLAEVPAGQVEPLPWSPGGISLLDTLGLRANAATKGAANSSLGFVSWNSTTLPISYTAAGVGDIVVQIDITLESANGQAVGVWFELFIDGTRADYKRAQSTAVTGVTAYSSCSLCGLSTSKSTSPTISLIKTVNNAPANWSWSYVISELKR